MALFGKDKQANPSIFDIYYQGPLPLRTHITWAVQDKPLGIYFIRFLCFLFGHRTEVDYEDPSCDYCGHGSLE